MILIEIVTYLIFSWVLGVVLQSFIHHFMIDTLKTRPIYIQWFILRGMAAIFHGIAFMVASMNEYFPILFFQVFSHIVIFAPLVNWLRHFKNPKIDHWYLGEDSGWFDRLFIKHPKFYKFVYYLSCVLAALSIVVIYIRYV